MATVIEYQIQGLDKLQAAFRRAGEAAQRPRALMLQLDQVMKNQVSRTFSAKRDPITGAPWQSTRRGGEILRDTGRLFRSIVAASPRVTDDSVIIGTNLPYASSHQEGMVITPQGATMLAIPLSKSAKRSQFARRWWNQNESKKPFIRKTRGGKLFIFTSQRGALTAHFLLLKSATIPQRRFIGIGNEYAAEIEQKTVAFMAGKIGGQSQ